MLEVGTPASVALGTFQSFACWYWEIISDVPANKVNSELHEGQQSPEVTHILWPFLLCVAHLEESPLDLWNHG